MVLIMKVGLRSTFGLNLSKYPSTQNYSPT